MPTVFQRRRDEFGNEYTTPAVVPLPRGHSVIDKPAIDHAGRPIRDKPRNPHHGNGVELRGNALDAALESAGLSKSGTVADKQARLAEHTTAEAQEDQA